MTRPKVNPWQRIRTPNACDQCKRRKSKCDGTLPCTRCAKAKDTCVYSPTRRFPSDEPPAKRQRLKMEAESPEQHSTDPIMAGKLDSAVGRLRTQRQQYNQSLQQPFPPLRLQPVVALATPKSVAVPRGRTTEKDHESSQDEDEECQSAVLTRMLWADARIVWLGHSAILTSLNFIRSYVLDLVGDSGFTIDRDSGKMLEHTHEKAEPSSPLFRRIKSLSNGMGRASANDDASCRQPDKPTTRRLVAVYFANTQAFFDLVSPTELDQDIVVWYRGDQIDTLSLCRIYLVLAIGCVLDPQSGPPEFAEAELLYQTASRMQAASLESPDREIIALWALRSIYMLAVSRRNDAWDHVRTAVGLAIGAGMHTPRHTKQIIIRLEDGVEAHNPGQRGLRCFLQRCNLWKSLFVLDSFLSALVGRPPAAPDLGCTEEGWDAMNESERQLAASLHPPLGGLDEAVNICRTMTMTLQRIYDANSTHLKTRLVREIAGDCRNRPQRDSVPLMNGRAQNASPLQQEPRPPAAPLPATTQLHLDLFRHHATILLTKPCFLWLYEWRCTRLPKAADLLDPSRLAQWVSEAEVQMDGANAASLTEKAFPAAVWGAPTSNPPIAASASLATGHRPPREMMRRISAACVSAAHLTMQLMSVAFESGEPMSPRNPFLISFLFMAILILMGNEVAGLHGNPEYESQAQGAVDILEHCARKDPQGKRLRYIITEFRKDVEKRKRAVLKVQNIAGHLLQPRDDFHGHLAPLDLIPPMRDGSRPRAAHPRDETARRPGCVRGHGNSSGGWSHGHAYTTLRAADTRDTSAPTIMANQGGHSGRTEHILLPPLDAVLANGIREGSSPECQSLYSHHSSSSGDVEFELSGCACIQTDFSQEPMYQLPTGT